MRRYRDQHVHVVPVDCPGIDRHLLASRYLPEQFTRSLSYITHQHRVTIFGYPHQVVLAVPYTVACRLVVLHPTILARSPKGEGFTDPLSGTIKIGGQVMYRIEDILQFENDCLHMSTAEMAHQKATEFRTSALNMNMRLQI